MMVCYTGVKFQLYGIRRYVAELGIIHSRRNPGNNLRKAEIVSWIAEFRMNFTCESRIDICNFELVNQQTRDIFSSFLSVW